jgi:hypothetical protein
MEGDDRKTRSQSPAVRLRICRGAEDSASLQTFSDVEVAMAAILIEPGNARDVPPSELLGLAAQLQALDPSISVEIVPTEPRPGAFGVTLWEVLAVFVGPAIEIAKVTPAIVRWLRRRHESAPGRPKSVTLYDANGRVLKVIRVKANETEPSEEGADASIPDRTPPRRILPRD